MPLRAFSDSDVYKRQYDTYDVQEVLMPLRAFSDSDAAAAELSPLESRYRLNALTGI